MREYCLRVVSYLLTLTLLVGTLSLSIFNIHAEDVNHAGISAMAVSENLNDQIKASVEQQIRAFADSIDKSGADDDAALALAKHGITGGGKKLSVSKNHALTATIFNSELMQVALIESCSAAIEMMQKNGLKEMNYVRGHVTWGLWEGSWGETNYVVNKYLSNQYTASNVEYNIASGLMLSSKANTYDKSLEWMASYAEVFLNFRLIKTTNNEITYQITCVADDRFDFGTSNNSGFKNLISGLAALFFREFDWESKVNFQLQVPNVCFHSGDFTSNVTKPTCTKGGYTTYTCTICGYSYTADKTKAKGHAYTSKVTAPTESEQGYTTHICKSCGDSYVDSYTDPLYRRGDLNRDGTINVDDVLICFDLAFVAPTEEQLKTADLDGNGEINVDDVLLCLDLCFA